MHAKATRTCRVRTKQQLLRGVVSGPPLIRICAIHAWFGMALTRNQSQGIFSPLLQSAFMDAFTRPFGELNSRWGVLRVSVALLGSLEVFIIISCCFLLDVHHLFICQTTLSIWPPFLISQPCLAAFKYSTSRYDISIILLIYQNALLRPHRACWRCSCSS